MRLAESTPEAAVEAALHLRSLSAAKAECSVQGANSARLDRGRAMVDRDLPFSAWAEIGQEAAEGSQRQQRGKTVAGMFRPFGAMACDGLR